MPTTARILIALGVLAPVASAGSVEFSGPFAQRAAAIVKRPTVHTVGAWEIVDADADLTTWFIDHPAAAGALWKEAGVEIGDVELLADGWRSRDPDGLVLDVYRLHQSAGLRAYYCKAVAPTRGIPRSVTAEFVLIHQIHVSEGTNGLRQSMDRMEAWVSADGAGLRVIMRLANGAVQRAVARSLRETKIYFAKAAKLAERRPQWTRDTLVKRPCFLSNDDFTALDAHLSRVAVARTRSGSEAIPVTAVQVGGGATR
jgi:hypothetical protein